MIGAIIIGIIFYSIASNQPCYDCSLEIVKRTRSGAFLGGLITGLLGTYFIGSLFQKKDM